MKQPKQPTKKKRKNKKGGIQLGWLYTPDGRVIKFSYQMSFYMCLAMIVLETHHNGAYDKLKTQD